MTVKMVAVDFWGGRQLQKVEAAPESIWAAFHFGDEPFEGVQLNPLQYTSWKPGK